MLERIFPSALSSKPLERWKAFDASLASRSAEKQMLRDAPPAELAEKLLHHFSAFQVCCGYAVHFETGYSSG